MWVQSVDVTFIVRCLFTVMLPAECSWRGEVLHRVDLDHYQILISNNAIFAAIDNIFHNMEYPTAV